MNPVVTGLSKALPTYSYDSHEYACTNIRFQDLEAQQCCTS